METKIKVNENSELNVRIKTREYVDELGRSIIESKWIHANGEVDLGSMKNPNKKILEFKYKIPDDKPLFQKLFGGE